MDGIHMDARGDEVARFSLRLSTLTERTPCMMLLITSKTGVSRALEMTPSMITTDDSRKIKLTYDLFRFDKFSRF